MTLLLSTVSTGSRSLDVSLVARLRSKIEPVVELLRSGSVGAQEEAAQALGDLGYTAESQTARAGAIEPLVALLHEPTTAATTRAAASTMEHVLAQQHDQSGPLAVPQLGSCASSGHTWRLSAALYFQGEAAPLGAWPLPRVLEPAASKADDFAAF